MILVVSPVSDLVAKALKMWNRLIFIMSAVFDPKYQEVLALAMFLVN